MGELESGGGEGGVLKPGGGGGTPKPEDGGGGGGAGGGARFGRELGGGEVMGGAGGGWVGLSTLVRFWAGAPYPPSLYLRVKERKLDMWFNIFFFAAAAHVHQRITGSESEQQVHNLFWFC